MEFRTEKKYTLDASHAVLAAQLLAAHCLPDPTFPRASVRSIYYDTLDLQFLTEKIDSTYLKAKVRLRWYGDWDFAPDDGPSFLESKIKEGGKQRKVRICTAFTGRQLQNLSLTDPVLSALPAELARRGVGLPAAVRPVFTIAYRRLRFLEPMTGTRIALDQSIHVPSVNLSGPTLTGTTALPLAVLETKGSLATLPPFLMALVPMGLRPEAFSKYLSCYQALMQQSA